MTEITRQMPKTTAQVEPYFEVLGADLTAQFLLRFGGAGLYFPSDPKGRSAVEQLIGSDKLQALANSTNRAMQKRVPLANRWLAQMLHWQGLSLSDIARTLRTTDVSVRAMLKAVPR